MLFNGIQRFALISGGIGLILVGMGIMGCKNLGGERPISYSDPTPEESMSVEKDTERPIAEVIDLSEDVPLFIVVAGVYSSEKGALSKVEELRKLGFANADTIQRPGSKLYSALVERFDKKSNAEEFTQDLMSNEKIKSYVYQLK